MKKYKIVVLFFCVSIMTACDNDANNTTTKTNNADATSTTGGGQENVQDNISVKDVVKVAISSKDHTTLVAALKQADLVTSLSNAGPFTVFAPTNEAFNKLPKETLDALMKDDKKADLQNILQYHVTLSAIKAESFTDGQVLEMVNGDNITVHKKDEKIVLNNSGATIIASIPASNGIIHVVDGVLLPPTK